MGSCVQSRSCWWCAHPSATRSGSHLNTVASESFTDAYEPEVMLTFVTLGFDALERQNPVDLVCGRIAMNITPP